MATSRQSPPAGVVTVVSKHPGGVPIKLVIITKGVVRGTHPGGHAVTVKRLHRGEVTREKVSITVGRTHTRRVPTLTSGAPAVRWTSIRHLGPRRLQGNSSIQAARLIYLRTGRYPLGRRGEGAMVTRRGLVVCGMIDVCIYACQ